MGPEKASDGHYLLADIGGTNTRVALSQGAHLIADSVRRFRNADYPGLEPVLAGYLAGQQIACTGACVAVAGPVRDGAAQLTNLDWKIDMAGLRGVTGAGTVAVLNDLQAQGHALGHLPPERLIELLPGRPAGRHETMLVIGMGTGFNCAPVYISASGRHIPPAEAGHASLPLTGPEVAGLGAYLAGEDGFAAVEDALAGRGLAHLYGWLALRTGHAADPDPVQVVTAATAGEPLALETLRLYSRILGQVVGDLSLIHLPYGGVFLTGGVARAVAPWLKAPEFAAAIHDKGRFGDFLKAFAVSVIDDDFAALTGCAHYLAALTRG